MDELSVLSQEAVILWRQILNGPVDVPAWEIKRFDVQEVISTGMVRKTVGVYPKYTLQLSAKFAHFGFDDTQRNFLTVLPLTMGEAYCWAEENHIIAVRSFIQNLIDLRVVVIDSSEGEEIIRMS